MSIKRRDKCVPWLASVLLLVFVCDAAAATLAQCRKAMKVVEVQQLDFGTFAGTDFAGTVIVGTSGSRSASGPVLAGGTINSGVFEVSSKRKGCDVYPVKIVYPNEGSETLVTGGINMPFNAFTSDPPSLFNISPLKNVATPVMIGSQVDVSANQSEGVYIGNYSVRFRHVAP